MAIKNAEGYLASALDSIAAQTFQDFEVIVVDGGSTDDSLRIARSYPNVSCMHQVGSGFANAWSQGIKQARSPLISFLDSDDLWTPDKLARQVAYLDGHPDKGYVVGRVQFFAGSEQTLPPGFKPQLLKGSHIAYMPGTTTIRRQVIDRIGLFEENWEIVSDIVWFQRLREAKVEAGLIDDVLLRKRVHASNLSYTTDWRIYSGELISLLKGGLDRRRLAKQLADHLQRSKDRQ